jgi:hypothetical protein
MYDLTIPPAVIIKAIPKDRVEDSQCLKMYLREYDDKRQASKKVFQIPHFSVNNLNFNRTKNEKIKKR